ncbi:DUF4870 domain-containing protein [Alteribacillus sp. HJP-4]|uniref:DUF4870 domain-containing protein n=1 Tax=Alteribacillus sp. HJP-4 TaxID=2775394 RepID=UPI0035CD14AC
MDRMDGPGSEKKAGSDQQTAAAEEMGGSQRTKTSTGLEENAAGLCCYLLGLITGIVFLVLEKENRFVRFHAMQSIIISGAFIILNIALTAIPFLGWIFGILLAPVGLVIWILLMMKAYQGKWYKFPIAGAMAEKQIDQFK